MSKMTWKRVAGKAAKMATVSAIAALAVTTSAKAEGQIINGYGAAPTTFGQPAYAQPSFGQPMMGQPVYGAPGMMMQPQFRTAPLASDGIAPNARAILPASAQTLAPSLPAGYPQQPQFAAQPQFGPQAPIFSNTQAMGITFGPPSYEKPKDFDPKMASSSPLPSHMMSPQQLAWEQQRLQHDLKAWEKQAPAGGWAQATPLPSPAGAPIYGGYAQPMLPASASMYAPAEPSYAPAEPLRPNYAAAAPAQPIQAAAAPTYESIEAPQTTVAATSQSYSYEMAPASTPAYVGQSQQIQPSAYATAPDPYEVVIGQQNATSSYEMGPSTDYTTTATTYGAPAPAYEQAPMYQAAPAYEPAPAYAPAPSYETSSIAAPAYTDSSFSSGNGHFVQVGAFRNIARAERLVRKLQSAGEQPIITQATVRGKLYHRVRIPAADKRDAKYVRDRVRGLGYYEARTVRG